MDSIRGNTVLQFGQAPIEPNTRNAQFRRSFDLNLFGNPAAALPTLNPARLFEYGVLPLSLPRFGLQQALRPDSTLVGPLRHLANSAPTVGRALIAMIRYMHHHSPTFLFRLEQRADYATLYFDQRQSTAQSTPHLLEMAVHGAQLLIGELRGTPLFPRAVSLRHAPLGNDSGYARYFGCPVLFDQPHDGLVLPVDVLQEACVQQDSDLHAIVRQFLENRLIPSGNLLAAVEARIQMLLPTQRCTLEQVALALQMNPRTLQRRLAGEGIEFEVHLDAIRRHQAQRMLRETTLSVGQIANELGYRRTTSFCRAHLRWFAMTPLEHRRQFGAPGIALR